MQFYLNLLVDKAPMRYWKKISIFLICYLITHQIAATHIVGGVIYYQYLGGNQYKLIFEIYKDCSPSVKIGFDGECDPRTDPTCQLPLFYYSVFKGNNNENIANYPQGQDNNGLLLLRSENIRPIIVNPCLTTDNTCVVKGTYETTITLPTNSDGYTIQYQRCCRNNGISNIQNQPGTNDKPGITLRTYIPPLNSYKNNSAQFKSFPPIFICAGQRFYFDHSATDADGDVLRYSLTTPLQGLSTNRPYDEVQSLNAPPIAWTSPYNLSNIMGGTPPMEIDSITGLLTCFPPSAGRFVVSVQIKEIRNGVVIDSFARDFQYNVRDCGIPNADAPFLTNTYDPKEDTGIYVKCGSLTQTFQNTSTNASRYEWDFGDPASGANNTSTAVNPTHTFSNSGRYVVTLTAFNTKPNGQLCSDMTKRICYIAPRPTVNFTAVEKCVQQSISFTDISTSNVGAITSWYWQFGDGATSTDKNPSHAYMGAGKFNVRLTVTVASCQADTTIAITVFPKPIINAVVPNGCIYQTMNLSCNVSVATGSILRYRWNLPDGTTFNTCNATYTPTTMATSSVMLWAETDKGCVDSLSFPFVVNPLPVIQATNDTTICYDQGTLLQATGATTYSWIPSTYLSNPSIANPIATPPYPNAIKYWVKGTDANGCYNYDSVTIRFYTKSYIDAGPDTSVCLNPKSPNYKPSIPLQGKGSFNAVYWRPTTGLDNPNILTPIASPTINTDYVLYGIDTNNCLVKDTVRIIALNPNLNFVLPNDTFICEHDTIQITGYDQGQVSTYAWRSIPSPSIFESFISNRSIRNPLFYPNDTVRYILQVSNYCYLEEDTILINVNKLPDPELKALDSICLGDIYTINTKDGFTSYLWTTSDNSISSRVIPDPIVRPTVTYTYVVEVTDQYGCKNKDTMRLEVNKPPALTVLGFGRYICLGDSPLLTAYTNEPCTYQWYNTATLSSDTARQVRAFPLDTTSYSVMATNIHQCSTTYHFTINVQKPIQPYAKTPVRICKGKYIDLYADGGLYYVWRPPYNINDTLSQTPQVYPDRYFTYTAYISNDCFLDSIKVDVYVDTLPVVDAGRDTTIYRGSGELMLTAKGQGRYYEWFPKLEILSAPFSPSITVSPMDTILYHIYVTDDNGCVGHDSIYVYVDGKNLLLIPTAFTPNNDGVNDIFHVIKHLNIRELRSLEVFNRWGEKVYSTQNIQTGWNGIYKDMPSPAGVYVWKVEAVSYDNDVIRKAGNVTLIR